MSDSEEIFDLVDADNRVIGQAPRSVCHGNPALAHRAVHVFVRDSGGRIFLQKRGPDKKVQPDRWDTSVGGHLLPGESYEDAARREAGEELGIDIETDELTRLHDVIWQTPIETEHVRTFSIQNDGPFTLLDTEIAAGRFWTVAELRTARGNGSLTPSLEDELLRVGLFAQADPR